MLALASCGGGEKHAHGHEEETHQEEAAHGASGEIVLAPEKAKAAGVK